MNQEIENIEKYRIETKSNEHRIMTALENIACIQKKQLQIMESQALKNSLLYTKVHDGVSVLLSLIESNC